MSRPPPRPLLTPSSTPELHFNSSLEEIRKVCGDFELPLLQRLEALEDVMESEVGDTPLFRARGLERRYGFRQLYLKFEGDNPTGTQKDRIAFAQVYDALHRGWAGTCFATCGNYGVAMAWATRVPGMRCLAVVPETYNAPRIRQMQGLGAEVMRGGVDYEEAVEIALERAEKDELYDANPGGDNAAIQLQAYKGIAAEIYDDLRDAPAAVAVPVSNGTTLAGIYRGFASLNRRGRTSRVPRMVAGSASRKNPIVWSWRNGMDTCVDLPPERIKETAANEPLINWHAIDGQLALDAIYATQGAAGDVNDKRMRELARQVSDDQGLRVQPASTAGLAALLALHAKSPLPPDRYVAVLTGRSQ